MKKSRARLAAPSRLHHNAYVTRDMETTRRFYEDLIGLPLVATWCESDVLFGRQRTYCHCFFALGDGSALTFFQFAHDEDQQEFGPELPRSPFVHIALKTNERAQRAIAARLANAGYGEPQAYILDHGYCRSLYTADPNGLLLEFTCDHADIQTITARRRISARRDLIRWLAGDHTSNNSYRHRPVDTSGRTTRSRRTTPSPARWRRAPFQRS